MSAFFADELIITGGSVLPLAAHAHCRPNDRGSGGENIEAAELRGPLTRAHYSKFESVHGGEAEEPLMFLNPWPLIFQI